MRILVLVFMLVLFGSCTPWRYYVPNDKTTRRSQSFQISIGRFFTDDRTACATFRVISYRKKPIEIEKEKIILLAGQSELEPLDADDAIDTYTFKSGLSKYFGGKAKASSLYVPDVIKLTPQKARSFMICYDIKEKTPTYQIHIKNLQIEGKSVKMTPFKLRQLKR